MIKIKVYPRHRRYRHRTRMRGYDKCINYNSNPLSKKEIQKLMFEVTDVNKGRMYKKKE